MRSHSVFYLGLVPTIIQVSGTSETEKSTHVKLDEQSLVFASQLLVLSSKGNQSNKVAPIKEVDDPNTIASKLDEYFDKNRNEESTTLVTIPQDIKVEDIKNCFDKVPTDEEITKAICAHIVRTFSVKDQESTEASTDYDNFIDEDSDSENSEIPPKVDFLVQRCFLSDRTVENLADLEDSFTYSVMTAPLQNKSTSKLTLDYQKELLLRLVDNLEEVEIIMRHFPKTGEPLAWLFINIGHLRGEKPNDLKHFQKLLKEMPTQNTDPDFLQLAAANPTFFESYKPMHVDFKANFRNFIKEKLEEKSKETANLLPDDANDSKYTKLCNYFVQKSPKLEELIDQVKSMVSDK